METIEAALRALGDSVHVWRGPPSSPAEVLALEAQLGVAFPDDLRRFLETIGWLCVEPVDMPEEPAVGYVGQPEIRQLNYPGAAQLLDAQERLLADADGALAEQVATVAESNCDVWDCMVVDARGTLQRYRAGQLYPVDRTFTEKVVGDLALLKEQIDGRTAGARLAEEVIAEVSELLGSEITDCVSLTLGDGRELTYGGPSESLRGLFYEWQEPACSLEELRQRNVTMVSCRGSLIGDRVRFRGRVQTKGVPHEELAWIIANDMGEEPAHELSVEEATPEELAEIVAGLVPRHAAAADPTEDGFELAWIVPDFPRGREVAVDIGINDLGLIELEVWAEIGNADAAMIANHRNRDAGLIRGQDDMNYDLENIAIAYPGDDMVSLSIQLPVSAARVPYAIALHVRQLIWHADAAKREAAGKGTVETFTFAG